MSSPYDDDDLDAYFAECAAADSEDERLEHQRHSPSSSPVRGRLPLSLLHSPSPKTKGIGSRPVVPKTPAAQRLLIEATTFRSQQRAEHDERLRKLFDVNPQAVELGRHYTLLYCCLNMIQQVPTVLFQKNKRKWSMEDKVSASMHLSPVEVDLVKAMVEIADDIDFLQETTGKPPAAPSRTDVGQQRSEKAVHRACMDVLNVVFQEALHYQGHYDAIYRAQLDVFLGVGIDGSAVATLPTVRRLQTLADEQWAMPLLRFKHVYQSLYRQGHLVDTLFAQAQVAQYSNNRSLFGFYASLHLIALWPYVELVVQVIHQRRSAPHGLPDLLRLPTKLFSKSIAEQVKVLTETNVVTTATASTDFSGGRGTISSALLKDCLYILRCWRQACLPSKENTTERPIQNAGALDSESRLRNGLDPDGNPVPRQPCVLLRLLDRECGEISTQLCAGVLGVRMKPLELDREADKLRQTFPELELLSEDHALMAVPFNQPIQSFAERAFLGPLVDLINDRHRINVDALLTESRKPERFLTAAAHHEISVSEAMQLIDDVVLMRRWPTLVSEFIAPLCTTDMWFSKTSSLADRRANFARHFRSALVNIPNGDLVEWELQRLPSDDSESITGLVARQIIETLANLRIRIRWPDRLRTIFTEEVEEVYSGVFSFLVTLCYAQQVLQNRWKYLRLAARTGTRQSTSASKWDQYYAEENREHQRAESAVNHMLQFVIDSVLQFYQHEAHALFDAFSARLRPVDNGDSGYGVESVPELIALHDALLMDLQHLSLSSRATEHMWRSLSVVISLAIDPQAQEDRQRRPQYAIQRVKVAVAGLIESLGNAAHGVGTASSTRASMMIGEETARKTLPLLELLTFNRFFQEVL